MKRKSSLVVLALALLGACQEAEQPIAINSEVTATAQVRVENGMVFTPSGAVFAEAEWPGIENKEAYMRPAEQTVARVLGEQRARLAAGVQASVTGQAAPKVLCHTYAYTCGEIPALIPGAQIVYWGDAQWNAATVAQFAQFDLIYLHDGAAYYSGPVNSKNVWGAATTGRLALTGVHFEHCYASWDANSGPCRVLKASVQWIHGGQGTGLLMSTQSSPNIMPTIAPYNGVTYYYNGGGFDRVRITDPGHATMQGSTDASLSNFGNSSHSIFGNIGGFTNVAEICDVSGYYPSACPGTYRPHFLVTSVGFADQDGDGVGDSVDNCPTVGNANQADANNNGVGDACESAPQVTISPATVSVPLGGSMTFTAAASDADHSPAQLTYEWRVNGIVQPGANGVSFTTTFNADATVRVTVRDPGLLSGFAEAAVTVITDATPPSITPNVAGTLGANGWYTSDVAVSWTVVDAESAITSQSGCTASSVTSDTNGDTFTCTATSAGGTASASVTVKRDATTPAIVPALSGTVGDNGWYVSDVDVSFAVSDAMSGIASQTGCASVSATSDTPGASYTCAVSDNAGLSNSASVSFKRDATAPVVAYAGNAGSYAVDQTVNITCSASDNLSGVASSTCADISGAAYTFALGNNSFSASATDNAGNQGSGSTAFTVTVSAASLCNLTKQFVSHNGIANSLCVKLNAAAASAARGNTNAQQNQLGAYINEVQAQAGKAISAANAATLIALANALM